MVILQNKIVFKNKFPGKTMTIRVMHPMTPAITPVITRGFAYENRHISDSE